MDVFLSILNINSIIYLDAVAKNRHGQWTGNKVLVNVGLIDIHTRVDISEVVELSSTEDTASC